MRNYVSTSNGRSEEFTTTEVLRDNVNPIRNEMMREELNVKPIIRKIERSQLQWFSHLVRMVGKSGKYERQKKKSTIETWAGNVLEAVKKRNMKWKEAIEMARNKETNDKINPDNLISILAGIGVYGSIMYWFGLLPDE
ncbi:hypothetical protein HHI36_008736 [Cryptolaemus montrouzieri]|uniref:Uncharacterized protein n=1 Tax=Cryptolaemus montrouzieri TaxID=559131 RepID=A0ABD2MTF0_9CUCU